jgi:hypothetical protein
MTRESRGFVVARATAAGTLLVTMIAAWPGSAISSNVIDDCGLTCEIDCADPPGSCREAVSGECELTADVDCTSSDASIMLVGGTDLQMNGYEITCTSASCGYYAVETDDNGSKVTNDGSGETSDPESLISGPFAGGVNCQLKDNSIVEKIMIADGLIAVLDCETVRNNVFLASTQSVFGINHAVATSGVTNSDEIVDNYMTGRTVPILTSGTEDIAILRNVIHLGTGLLGVRPGQNQTVANGDIKFNVFFGEGFPDSSPTIISLGAGTTDNIDYQGNFCDENHPDCATCQADGRCESHTAPFPGN